MRLSGQKNVNTSDVFKFQKSVSVFTPQTNLKCFVIFQLFLYYHTKHAPLEMLLLLKNSFFFFKQITHFMSESRLQVPQYEEQQIKQMHMNIKSVIENRRHSYYCAECDLSCTAPVNDVHVGEV